MRDINDVLPPVPNMKWGALTNVPPTLGRVREMDRVFPANGRWHTVFEDAEKVRVDGAVIWKKSPESWT